MTFRQLERKYIELQEAIRELPGGVDCSDSPQLFFPDDLEPKYRRQQAAKKAKIICNDCPVRVRCRDYATAAGMVGIWGGTTADERRPPKD